MLKNLQKILITFMMFGLSSISSANSFRTLNQTIDLEMSVLINILRILGTILFFSILINQLIKMSSNEEDNSNKNNSSSKTVTEQKPTKIQENQKINNQQPKLKIYMPNLSRIDELVKQFESLQNGLKLVHYELDKNQTIKFNLLKEQAYNEFKKIDWMKNYNKDVADSYQIILDDYENAMMAEYERLKEQLNYILKNSIEENSNSINLIKNI
jgi:hypothetical protein